ncbi:hypothetical protein N7466_004716 [Penicillium verhagenii]|uniref:uncharacterized protein n=1 Tax=Penicillium verhagenii TaxID=1562060 RepID=UPI00254528E6|nr:uncharacterized protein N7466_004716 [Penicillium verhagenii]KAJ5935169.1 hypothetical protein N7466_004716 [Penicillium verhagenii]
MASTDLPVGASTLDFDVSMLKPPIRIILHVLPNVQQPPKLNVRANCLAIAQSFFDQTKPQLLSRKSAYVHSPLPEEKWESRVIIDACTGEIIEGSVSDQIPLSVFIVSQGKKGCCEEEGQPGSGPSGNTPISLVSLSYLPVRLQGYPIRVVLVVPVDETVGDLRSRCTAAARAFLELMMMDVQQRKKTFYLIRGMTVSGPDKKESQMVIDYWIGQSKGTEQPPLLTVAYQGQLQPDGQMKFQPTEGGKSKYLVFLMKHVLAKDAVTIEGEVAAANQTSFSSAPEFSQPPVSPQAEIDGWSDIMASGDWVMPDKAANSGALSWEFIGRE